MSAIALVSYSLTHNSHIYFKTILEGFGHTVTSVVQSDVPSTSFTSYDLIVTTFTDADVGASLANIVSAVDGGVPILIGYDDVASGDNTTNLLAYELDLISNITRESGTLRTNIDDIIPSYLLRYMDNRDTGLFSMKLSVSGYFNLPYTGATIAPSALSIANASYDDKNCIIIAPAGGTDLGSNTFGAPVIWFGGFARYDNASSTYNWTAEGLFLLEEMVDLLLNGFGVITGTVQDSTPAYAARTVRLYEEETGLLVGETISDATTGAFSFIGLNSNIKYTAVCYDEVTRDEAALIYDLITPS